ncbi:MAG: phage holin family protein [Burkholderiales bacterium]|nr:phage holin family protein [Burkholderiales bacterium]
MAEHPTDPKPPGGVLDALRGLVETSVALVHTRLEILATEIEEERIRLKQYVLLALATAFCLGFALILAVLLVLVVFWDDHKILAVSLLLAVFLVSGGALAFTLVRQARARPMLFSATLAELAKDRDRLKRP